MKMVKVRAGNTACIASIALLLISSLLIMTATTSPMTTANPAIPAFAQQSSDTTYESWNFRAPGDVLFILPAGDISGDGIGDLAVASDDKSIYMIDGLTGTKIWTYTASDLNDWVSILSSSTSASHGANFDVNGDDKSEVFVVSQSGLVLLLDGAEGKQVWNITKSTSQLSSTDLCFPAVRSAHMISDIDGDDVQDVVIVAGSGDQCGKNDVIELLALSTRSGEKIWEFVHEEDFHGLKDGIQGSTPAGIVDINKDGVDDVIVADDRKILYVINGKNGNPIEIDDLEIAGEIWNFMIVPDISGDGVKDAIAFEFIDGQGGPDYASVDAINLASLNVIWRVNIGDGLYDGGAAYSAAYLARGSNDESEMNRIAVTQRIENDLHLVVLNTNTGQKMWQFSLGEDKSRNDIDKHFPVARVSDLNGNNHDEIVVGSIDSKVYLLDGSDGAIIWRYSNVAGVNFVSYLQSEGDAKVFVLFSDLNDEVHALAGLTPRSTDLTIRASDETILVSSKLTISGLLSPPFPGEIISIRYIDPNGSEIKRPLIVEKDGSYADIIKPEIVGTWKVSSSFNGEGYYLDSQSPTIAFDVVNEIKNSVYLLTIATPTGGSGSTEVSYPIVYLIEGGEVSVMSIDKAKKSLDITIKNAESLDEITRILKIELPRGVIDSVLSDFQVYLDGKAASFEEIEKDSDTHFRTLSIPFSAETKKVQIVGTYIVPEFSTFALIVFAAAVISVIIATTLFSRHGNGRAMGNHDRYI